MRILVVDDEKLIRWSIERILVRLGHEVDGAGDLKNAENLLRDNQYDLVLCDYIMPEGCGDELMEEVRQKHPEMRRVVMSGDLSQKGVRGIHADAFLEKPFLKDELTAVIRKVMSRKSNVDS